MTRIRSGDGCLEINVFVVVSSQSKSQHGIFYAGLTREECGVMCGMMKYGDNFTGRVRNTITRYDKRLLIYNSYLPAQLNLQEFIRMPFIPSSVLNNDKPPTSQSESAPSNYDKNPSDQRLKRIVLVSSNKFCFSKNIKLEFTFIST